MGMGKGKGRARARARARARTWARARARALTCFPVSDHSQDYRLRYGIVGGGEGEHPVPQRN